jgi:hypothetical protein
LSFLLFVDLCVNLSDNEEENILRWWTSTQKPGTEKEFYGVEKGEEDPGEVADYFIGKGLYHVTILLTACDVNPFFMHLDCVVVIY